MYPGENKEKTEKEEEGEGRKDGEKENISLKIAFHRAKNISKKFFCAKRFCLPLYFLSKKI